MPGLTPEEQKKQIAYRDARFSKQYDGIWQSVGKCVFCDLNQKYVFFEENGIVLTITLYAYIDGHMMIVPRRHITSAKELTPAEWQSIRKCMYIAKKLIKKVHNISGMQLVQKDGAAAQSTVEHIHFHAIPFDTPDLCKWNFRKLTNTPLENVALYREQDKKIKALAAKFDEKYLSNEPIPTATDTETSQQKSPYELQWSSLAFGSKKPINKLKATFIAAPRLMSVARFTQLIREYLPKGNIVLGIASEPYILGFEGQPHFKTLQTQTLQALIAKVNASNSLHKIYTLSYSQHDTKHLIEKLDFTEALFVNGSWAHSFHLQPAYFALMQRGLSYKLVSPFASRGEAQAYEELTDVQIAEYLNKQPLLGKETLTNAEMLELAGLVAKQSYDYSFQTGVALGKKTGKNYTLLLTSFNRVVPYQTYAMHNGASREVNFSAPGDLNHYDAVHAETELIITAGKQGVSLKGTTLFINLLPCPTCARMLADTDIAEFVYQLDHSDGYAVQLLEAAGKRVRRLVTKEKE